MQQLARKGWGREYIQNVARAIIFPHNVDLSIHLPPAGIPRSFLFVFFEERMLIVILTNLPVETPHWDVST
jgi:hypothetical protein